MLYTHLVSEIIFPCSFDPSWEIRVLLQKRRVSPQGSVLALPCPYLILSNLHHGCQLYSRQLHPASGFFISLTMQGNAWQRSFAVMPHCESEVLPLDPHHQTLVDSLRYTLQCLPDSPASVIVSDASFDHIISALHRYPQPVSFRARRCYFSDCL